MQADAICQHQYLAAKTPGQERMLFSLNARPQQTISPAISFRLTSMLAIPPVRIDALQNVQAHWLQARQHSSHLINIVHLVHSVFCAELFQTLQERCTLTGRGISTSVQAGSVCLGPNFEAQAPLQQ